MGDAALKRQAPGHKVTIGEESNAGLAGGPLLFSHPTYIIGNLENPFIC